MISIPGAGPWLPFAAPGVVPDRAAAPAARRGGKDPAAAGDGAGGPELRSETGPKTWGNHRKTMGK